MKLFIPLICYNRTCHTDYMMSIMKLLSHFHKSNSQATFYPIFWESLISRGRNAATAEFLKSDCTHILFIDADISFEPNDVEKLIISDKDVICSPYPKKYLKLDRRSGEELVDFAVSGKIEKVSDRLYEIESVATGFLLIKKEVFKRLIEAYPDIEYINDIDGYGPDTKMWDFFKVGINKETNIYDSEDWGFCTMWRKIGGRVFARNDINLTHWGWYQFKGNFNNWVYNNNKSIDVK